MLDFVSLASCAEISSVHAKLAASASSHMRLFLERTSEIARPGEGCPKVLGAVAHLVGQEWVDGRLHVELTGDDDVTTLSIFADYGVGIRERLLPATRFAVPFDEFSRALELAPALVLPLRISDHGNKLVLTPLLTPEEEAEQAPPTFEVDDRSLGEDLRKTAPPPDQYQTAPPPSDVGLLRESIREEPTRPNHMILTDEDE